MKSTWTMFQFLRPHFRGSRWMILRFVAVAALFIATGLVAQPYVLGQFLDGITGGGLSSDRISFYCLAFLMVAVLNVLLSYFCKILSTRTNIRVTAHVCGHLYQHVQKTSPRYHGGKNTTELINKIYNDSTFLVSFFINLGLRMPGMVLTLILALSYIFYTDLWCGFASLCILPLTVLLNMLFGKRITVASENQAQARDRYFSSLDEQLRSLASIRRGVLFDILGKRFAKSEQEFENASVRTEKVNFPYSMINENLDALVKVFLMAYSGHAILQGAMTIGQFTILNSYVAIVSGCFSYFLEQNQQAQQYLAYYQRLKELTDIPEEGNGRELPTPLENIMAEGLNFSYTEGTPVLENLSQTFERDKIYCLAGRNGSGKSTLSDILLGLYVSDGDPSVKYNGVPLQDIDLYEMRASHTGVSEQEPMMLNGSVGFNITYREDGERDEGRLRELLEMVDFRKGEVDAQNLDALLALNANELSGGQKQKVSIVKALYKDPELLVLDEPTSALDAGSRKRLADYLKTHAKGRITILVSHDRELLDIADEVVRLGKERA